MAKIPVLVLDDDEDITLLTRSALAMHGYDVTESNDPLQALELVGEREFGLILVDIMMPQMDGVEFISQARQLRPDAPTRYAVLTAKKLDEAQRRAIFDLGAEIMTKPFIPIKLVERVAELLR
ncbi:MAG: response regulator [Gemmatimonadetes bacterium]|jgi:DNA-binding response OmpR family regulator|nr:response regulator [Gemmatimonadota bacterium]